MLSKAVFYDLKEDEKGTWLKVHVPNEYVRDYLKQEFMTGEIRIDDGRRITADQRKKIYALIRDISVYTGHEVEFLKENVLKIGFMMKENYDYFSLATVDVTTARYFIEYILEFCFEWNVPLDSNTAFLTRDVSNWLYLCIKHRKCSVCGLKSEIHHHEHLVGMGGNRKTHDHINSKFISLCRTHHNECHTIGFRTFEKKYKVSAIKLNHDVIKRLNL